jgi:hypothetical protein
MEEIFLPVLHSFENGNVFTGSSGALRFKATPVLTMLDSRNVDFPNSGIRVEYWHGLFCYEKSQVEEERTFPLSKDGIEEIRQWLTSVK